LLQAADLARLTFVGRDRLARNSRYSAAFSKRDAKSSTDKRDRSCNMTLKSKTLASAALAVLAGLAMAASAPALAQDQSQSAPAAQTYQNDPGSAQNPNGQNNGMYGQPSGAGRNSSMGTSQGTGAGATNTSSNTQSLNSVQNAKTTLASAQVQDSNGQQVGQVSTVHTSTSGKPTKIDITLSSNNGNPAKTVAVNASQLRYDPNSNTLITNLTATDLQSMPAASSSSGM
jgi:hypothetical protein